MTKGPRPVNYKMDFLGRTSSVLLVLIVGMTASSPIDLLLPRHNTTARVTEKLPIPPAYAAFPAQAKEFAATWKDGIYKGTIPESRRLLMQITYTIFPVTSRDRYLTGSPASTGLLTAANRKSLDGEITPQSRRSFFPQ
eukprot:jgi/Bigna1/126663/aug1.3_g1371